MSIAKQIDRYVHQPLPLMRQRLAVVVTAVLVLVSIFLPLSRVVLAGIALLAPGYLLWSVARRDVYLPHFAGMTLIVGLSLSLIPLTFLWTTTLGLVLSPLVLRLMLAGTVLLAGWRLRREPRPRVVHSWLAGGLLFTFALTFAVRLFEIRNVALPLWVDSVHHALLIRIVGETGRYPSSLQPYIPVDHLAYHWGYHVVAATWQAIAAVPLHTLMLLSGQLLNALHVLTIYGLTVFLTRSPRAGLFAALAVGLLSSMPAYYVTWGRYTQLTGLLVLPALIICSCALSEAPRRSASLLALTAVTMAGLILVHYRVLVFYVAFMLAYLAVLAARRPRQLPRTIGRLVVAGLSALLLAAPWVWVLGKQVLVPAAQNPESLVGGGSYNSIDPSLLWMTNNRELFAAAGIGVLLALARLRWRILVPALWIGTLLLLANPTVIGLRPLWLINNHSVIITLFMPICVLTGFAAERIVRTAQRLSRHRASRRVRYALELLLFVGLAAYGAWQLRDIVNPVTDLATAADLPALQWAEQNTPPDARFLINATPWLNGVYRGTDAGWWLMPFAGRWTSTPPALYNYGTVELNREVAARSGVVAGAQPDGTQSLDQLIKAQHITHIFLGSKGGPLRGEMFWGRPQYRPVYDQSGVLIFEVQESR